MQQQLVGQLLVKTGQRVKSDRAHKHIFERHQVTESNWRVRTTGNLMCVATVQM